MGNKSTKSNKNDSPTKSPQKKIVRRSSQDSYQNLNVSKFGVTFESVIQFQNIPNFAMSENLLFCYLCSLIQIVDTPILVISPEYCRYLRDNPNLFDIRDFCYVNTENVDNCQIAIIPLIIDDYYTISFYDAKSSKNLFKYF